MKSRSTGKARKKLRVDREGRAAIYDLERDPGETAPLVPRTPADLRMLERARSSWRTMNLPSPDSRPSTGDPHLDALRALGYVE